MDFRCPSRDCETGARVHGKPVKVWFKVMAGSDSVPRSWRPWCKQCLEQSASTDSVIVAQRITDFYPGAVFALALAAVERWRRQERAKRGLPPDSEPADVNRESEFAVLSGCYTSRAAVTPRAWQRMQGLRPLET